MPDSPANNDGWEKLWNERRTALESILGSAGERVFHALIPFYLDGNADVLEFRHHVEGVMYCTAELIGSEFSQPNIDGQYELMIAVRHDADWAANLLSRLARYTIEAVLQPWDTMDIGPALPQPTSVTTFLYVPYATLVVQGRPANLLLCLGITAEEVALCRESGCEALIDLRKSTGKYPFTDL